MTVDSGDYVLAVPDFGVYARSTPDSATVQAQQNSISSQQHEQKLKKVIMKLSGKVRWQVGMVFERDVAGGTRSFDFIPHYNVTLRNPVHIKSIKTEVRYTKGGNVRERLLTIVSRKTMMPSVASGATIYICPSLS